MKTLKGLVIEELAERYDSEKQLILAMPNIISAATCIRLKNVLQAHLNQTAMHVVSLEKIFSMFGEKPYSKTCQGILGLLKEGDKISCDFSGSQVINAALISAVQKIEHYEIASYGCMHEWARVLQNDDAAQALQSILSEEIEANRALIELARSHSNAEALGKDDPEKPCCMKGPDSLTPPAVFQEV